jgi:hypothetical protein
MSSNANVTNLGWSPHVDLVDHLVGLGVDAGDDAVVLTHDPHRTVGDRDPLRRRANVDAGDGLVR